MRAKVHVSLKAGVLDPQGKAVGDALVRLGFDEVGAVRCGKTIELELNDGLSKADAEKRVKDMCEKLLANTDLDRLLENLMDECIEVARADKGFLILMESNQLRVKVAPSGAVSLIEQEISPREDNFVACVRRAAMLPRVVGATTDEPQLRVRYEIVADPDGMRLVRFGWKPER